MPNLNCEEQKRSDVRSTNRLTMLSSRAIRPVAAQLAYRRNRGSAIGVALVAVFATGVGGLYREAGSAQPVAGGVACHPSPPDVIREHWLPSDPALARTAQYGASDDQAIGSFGGLAYREGALYLFDQSKPEVLILSPESLLPVRRFGRRGEGPGEFWGVARPFPLGRFIDFGFLAAGSSGIAVYDGTGIELFDLAGVFKQRFLEGVPSSRVFGFRYVGSTEPEGRILFAVDRASGTGGARHLQTLSFNVGDESTPPTSGSSPRTLWELPLTHPPTTQRGVVVPRLQARPLWTVWGRCVIVADGASDHLWVFNIDTGVAEKHQLPNWPLPPTAENDSGGRFRSLPGSGAAPTARIRWEDLVVDPSGAAWVRQWSSQMYDSARVAVVDLRDGEIRDVQVPAFPRAFGDSGTYFAVERGSLTQVIIASYTVDR